jgi:hypothetical protein
MVTVGEVKRPARLKARGRGFWDQALAVYDLSGTELALLAEACRTMDELEALSATLSRDGLTVEGSTGQTRVHPALGELRAARVVLSRLLAQLALPDDDGQAVPSATRLRAVKAAGTRWEAYREKWGDGDGPAAQA